MCGRTVMALQPDELMQKTGAKRWTGQETYRRSHNVGPGRTYPVIVRKKKDGDAGEGEWELHSMRWGMIPFFMSEKPDNLMRTINARDDTIKTGSRFWQRSSETSRCIVPFQGFFEWQRSGKIGNRCDYLLYAAGLWDRARIVNPVTGEKEEVYSFAIVTTEAAKSMSWLHDRMPVFLWSKEDCDRWLDPNLSFRQVEDVLKSSEDGLKWHAVNTFVNKVGNDTPECIVPVTEKKGTLFKFLKSTNTNTNTTTTTLPPVSSSSPDTETAIKESTRKRKELSDNDDDQEGGGAAEATGAAGLIKPETTGAGGSWKAGSSPFGGVGRTHKLRGGGGASGGQARSSPTASSHAPLFKKKKVNNVVGGNASAAKSSSTLLSSPANGTITVVPPRFFPILKRFRMK
ncbi:hypothetical protein BC829DRAFT_380357 [Chytridium lagenaria]|nr:hypothetical protein BC829DRAFT_380357 [Chytridium lagenaria]